MPFLLVNPDNTIQNITETDENATGIEVTAAEMSEVAANRTGHSVFDFIGGVIVLNTVRNDAEILIKAKLVAIDDVIEQEAKDAARGRQQAKITSMENAPTLAALEAIKVAP